MWVIVNMGAQFDQAPSYLLLDGEYEQWTAYPVDGTKFYSIEEVEDIRSARPIPAHAQVLPYSDSLPCGCEECHPEAEED